MRAATALIVAGVALLVAGLVVRFAPGLVSWFGKLPGDLRFESESTKVFVPITSVLVVSLVLSTVLWIVIRFRDG